MLDSGRVFTWAWQVLPAQPSSLVRAGFWTAARLVHAFRLGGVGQLEQNLHRITGLEGKALRRLSKENITRYMQYYAEVFQLPRFTTEQLAARVRTVNAGPVREALAASTVVAGLGHLGNWDLAGAWSGENFAHVVTVAEKLEPEELFQKFLHFREDLGMTIHPFGKGQGLFSRLVHDATSKTALMPLLADRDLSRDGIVVGVCGHDMRVAPGPAAVAVAAGVPFVGVFIHHERLTGQRRRAAGSPWGIVIEFTDPIKAPVGSTEDAVGTMMQAWADRFSDFLRRHPQDWHMLQKCFLADLDAERLQSAGGGAYGGRA